MTIDGGSGDQPEAVLDGPLMLPGETNLPLADGTSSATHRRQRQRHHHRTRNATNVSAADGERPGFDPRMNDFPYTIEFLDGRRGRGRSTVGSVSQDILSFANSTAFPVELRTRSGRGTTFSGTPDQSAARLARVAQAGIDFCGTAERRRHLVSS